MNAKTQQHIIDIQAELTTARAADNPDQQLIYDLESFLDDLYNECE